MGQDREEDQARHRRRGGPARERGERGAPPGTRPRRTGPTSRCPPRRPAPAPAPAGRGSATSASVSTTRASPAGLSVWTTRLRDLGRHRGLEVEDQRRPQICEGRDEDQGEAREEPRQRERQRHGAQDAQAVRPQVPRRVAQGGVDVRQRRLEAQEEDRQEVQRLQEDDPGQAAPAPAEPVGRPERVDPAQLVEQEVQAPEAGEDLLQPDRPHEGRQDQRQEQGGRRAPSSRGSGPAGRGAPAAAPGRGSASELHAAIAKLFPKHSR